MRQTRYFYVVPSPQAPKSDKEAQQELRRVAALCGPEGEDCENDDSKGEGERRRKSIWLDGIDDTPVESEIQVGQTIPAHQKGKEYVLYDSKFLSSSKSISCDRARSTLREIATGKAVIEEEDDMSRGEAELFFANVRDEWEGSKTCRELRGLLSSISTSKHKIGKVVAFACNSMARGYSQTSGNPDHPAPAKRAAYQHALALTLTESFSGGNESAVAADAPLCYAQDPAYIDVDKAVLGTQGITVLEDPGGFIEVDGSTVIISCAPNVPVKQVV
ncbi:hypothetical protein K431DRAFT_345957 [Polychaeton citri CBS 116435]|uniref:SRR1-like domain-containing protein n=1 Tax=Polychaeton citri CBS 116435 TaxID=1314669 RepID=A0A9P4UN53_9PEZI|nr:hypothetical protein K431DRAFT_345957 [Polychaeton citri CBS 116435]